MLPEGLDAKVSAALHLERPSPIGSVNVEFDIGSVVLLPLLKRLLLLFPNFFHAANGCSNIVEELILPYYMQQLVAYGVVV